MKILSHRGLWNSEKEKNKIFSFERSFISGFGTETDLRDYNNGIVISHDIPESNSLNLDHFFTLYNKYSTDLPLALNIKSDGLQNILKEKLNNYNVDNYFVFDMSIPDTLSYIKQGLKFFTRQSEFEKKPCFYSEAIGVWLDSFDYEWYDMNLIENHLLNGKMVSIVSPELHKRSHKKLWNEIKEYGHHKNSNILLCTDLPLEAKEFFER